MKGICVRNEIQPLKKVLLHRPGRELLKLTPKRLGELLFDDIPYLKDAQREHDAFAAILRENGVEVVYLEDLMSEVLAAHTELVRPFLYQWLAEGNIKTGKWRDRLCDYLLENYSGKALVEKTMEGIALKEMGGASACSLQDLIAPADDVIVDPMPNLYFTRDPFASVGRGVFVNRMRFPTRRPALHVDAAYQRINRLEDSEHGTGYQRQKLSYPAGLLAGGDRFPDRPRRGIQKPQARRDRAQTARGQADRAALREDLDAHPLLL